MEKGNLSINSENFLPIIKKWLYTDKDIFVRELISNGCDAVTKLKKLMVMGNADHIPADEKFFINVIADKQNGTLQFIDNGIGMTGEEIKKYINQIAFSGASDFLAKFQEKSEEDRDIIGHFGLGFYSAFMVADKVEIDSLSYEEGAAPAHWVCEGGIEFQMGEGSRETRGTTITLHLGEDEKEFLGKYALTDALEKYCSFMPVEIYLDVVEEEKPEDKKEAPAEGEGKPAAEEEKPDAREENLPINDPNPLWLKKPGECKEEDYIAFYTKVFMDLNEPLFWIHLNMDYPFRLKGILYFPHFVSNMDTLEGKVKLYSNQVFIADNIKEVIPEFLLLLKGVIDCPDLPLNVSRSQLQNDGYSRKMAEYITKKVADKLNQLFKNERESYNGFWSHISLFVKYGCMKEQKFYDRIKESLIFGTADGNFVALGEYAEKLKGKIEDKVYFASDRKQQSQYINLFKAEGIDVLLLEDPIDKPFINFLESKMDGKPSFLRVDADISDALKSREEPAEDTADKTGEELGNLMRSVLGKKDLKVRLEALKSSEVSAVLLLSEDSRRLMEIRESYKNNDPILNMIGNADPDVTLVLNKNNRLIKILTELKGREEKAEDAKLICKQVYDLALMAHKPLNSGEMTEFIERSNLILAMMAEKL